MNQTENMNFICSTTHDLAKAGQISVEASNVCQNFNDCNNLEHSS